MQPQPKKRRPSLCCARRAVGCLVNAPGDRRASQEQLEALQTARSGEKAWTDLASAHHADTGHPSRIYMRPGNTDNGTKFLCEGTAGEPQGSTITNVAFPVLICSSLKGAEAKFTGAEIRGILDDVGLYSDPAPILGMVSSTTAVFAEVGA